MNPQSNRQAHQSAAVPFWRGGGGPEVHGNLPRKAHSELRWLDVTIRAVDARRDDLELTHWKKVWRSTGKH